MRTMDANVPDLVVAAQRGDRDALDALVEVHLPLVYNIVGRALDGDADLDDVVQNIMLRVVRDLRSLRTPGSFRSWLAAIAVRQVGTHRQQRDMVRNRTATLDDAVREPDPGAEVENVSLLQAQLTGQRREVAEATRWLDPDDRSLSVLWWQEVAGVISRGELAGAAGLSVAHAGVRIQRMREQLDLARTVVGALASGPACPELRELTADWDGRPGALWRKRIARHARPCPRCSATTRGHIAADRLLAGLPVLVVPGGLAELTLAKTAAIGTAGSAPAGAAAGAGVKAAITKLLAAHPLAAAVAAVTAATVIAVPVVRQTTPEARGPAVAAAPASRAPAAAPSSRAVTPLERGRVSLEWADGGYLSAGGSSGVATVARVTAGARSRERATFVVVAGLADPKCVSLRTLDGRYLRHYELAGFTQARDSTEIFPKDATYCTRPGDRAGTITLVSLNYPAFCLRWTGERLGLGYIKDTAEFRTASTFRIRPALATG